MRAQRIQRGNWVYRQNRQGSLFIKRETFIFGAFSNKGPCFNKAVNIKRENRRQRRSVHINSDPESHQINPPDGIHRSTSSLLLHIFTFPSGNLSVSSSPSPPIAPLLVRFLSLSHAVVVFQKKVANQPSSVAHVFFVRPNFLLFNLTQVFLVRRVQTCHRRAKQRGKTFYNKNQGCFCQKQ